ncbi:DNRLRE domain-containing protein [Patescibacteria group bacterium]|nr:MAG: DNRLRE domain-containing protein [Patescibacteria group bacterium]
MKLTPTLLVASFGILFLPAVAAAETVTLNSSADTYISNNYPTNSYGGIDTAFVQYQSGPSFSRTLLKFDLSSIPVGSTVQAAELALTFQSVSTSTTVTLQLYRAGESWSETSATWNSAPTLSDLIVSQLTSKNAAQKWTVTDAVKNWVAGTWSNNGLILKSTEGSGNQFTFGYWTREAALTDSRPKLTVTYTPPAAPPPAPPALPGVAISGASVATSAQAVTVSFTTNPSATGTIEYGVTSSYGSTKTEIDPAWTLHAITLTSLTPSTTYHYRIRASASGYSEGVTADQTFTTKAAWSTPVPPGTLVKTADAPAVYYVAEDGKRHAFPNEKIYKSWYADFSSVQTITASSLASMALGKNVVYRPGVKMVKFQTLAKVYTVGPKGELRWITNETLAAALYGADWNQKIDDLSDAFFTDYHYGTDITATSDFSPTSVTAAATTIDGNL